MAVPSPTGRAHGESGLRSSTPSPGVRIQKRPSPATWRLLHAGFRDGISGPSHRQSGSGRPAVRPAVRAARGQDACEQRHGGEESTRRRVGSDGGEGHGYRRPVRGEGPSPRSDERSTAGVAVESGPGFSGEPGRRGRESPVGTHDPLRRGLRPDSSTPPGARPEDPGGWLGPRGPSSPRGRPRTGGPRRRPAFADRWPESRRGRSRSSV